MQVLGTLISLIIIMSFYNMSFASVGVKAIRTGSAIIEQSAGTSVTWWINQGTGNFTYTSGNYLNDPSEQRMHNGYEIWSDTVIYFCKSDYYGNVSKTQQQVSTTSRRFWPGAHQNLSGLTAISQSEWDAMSITEACGCPSGKELWNGICVDPCQDGYVHHSPDGVCVPQCPQNASLVPDPWRCICDDGYAFENGQCVEIPTCEERLAAAQSDCGDIGVKSFSCEEIKDGDGKVTGIESSYTCKEMIYEPPADEDPKNPTDPEDPEDKTPVPTDDPDHDSNSDPSNNNEPDADDDGEPDKTDADGDGNPDGVKKDYWPTTAKPVLINASHNWGVEARRLDLKPIFDVNDKIMQTDIGQAVSKIAQIAENLVGQGEAPRFEFTIMGRPLVLDLSVMDDTVNILRNLFSLLIWFGFILVIIRQWRWM